MLVTVLGLACLATAEPAPTSFAYVLQADSLAKTKPAVVERLVACGRDWVVLDKVFGGDTPWEHAGLDAIRRGQQGRKVIAYISIGEAEDYRPYWRKDWVKAIAARARLKNPAALVIPQNGSPLLAHADFLQTISGIGIEDLFTNGNKLQPKLHTSEVLGHLKQMTGAKKPVLLIEYPKTAERQTLVKKLANENGCVWLLTDRQLKTLGESGT